jgi:hypothetical protein
MKTYTAQSYYGKCVVQLSRLDDVTYEVASFEYPEGDKYEVVPFKGDLEDALQYVNSLVDFLNGLYDQENKAQ